MKRAFLELSVFLFAFFGIWFGLQQFDFMETFKVNEKTSQLEKKLGDFYVEYITKAEEEILDKDVLSLVSEIKNTICDKNNIDSNTIKVHILKTSEINAFALPDNHLIINSELIQFCQNPEELAGVMAHEIAHMEKNHIMKKLSKEIGFAALSSMITSGTGGMEGIRILSSSAYDRKMEKEADHTAVEYLQKSKINPMPFADFMYRLSTSESSLHKKLTLISTHPETESRAETILELSGKEDVVYQPLFNDSIWKELQQKTQYFEY